ncbi:WYL domain-containing protein, partial [Dietzia sp.]|uniref:WYL domain-containing protein n=1 Tax=Dietzia sp. TaxID=1871616 RepID=UPI003FA5A86C
MLTVLAYFRRQGGPTRVSEAARALEITAKQLRDTLTQLWTCGLPGYGPGDLIDLAFWSEPAEVPAPGSGSVDDGAGAGSPGTDSFDDDADLARADYVEVIEFAGITRPLRLTFEEAITLKTALAALAGREEVVDPEGLEEALQMLSAVAPADVPLDAMATGSGPSSSGGVSGGATATELRAALRQGHAVRFLYHSAGSDSTRLRVVDGGHLHVEPEHSYLR